MTKLTNRRSATGALDFKGWGEEVRLRRISSPPSQTRSHRTPSEVEVPSRVNLATGKVADIHFYIHKNAVHHRLAKKIGAWSHDSYQAILSNRPTSLKREEVIEWFGSAEQFIKFHDQPVDPKITIEDL